MTSLKAKGLAPQIEVDVVSIAPTEEAQEESLQRFTAAGRPMPPQSHSGLASMSLGPLGSSSTPNTLPWRFRDTDFISIPIPTSALQDLSASPITTGPPPSQRRKLSSSVLSILTGRSSKKKDAEFKMVRMTRGEYLKYWAKDEEGRYVGTEPEGEGRERLRMGLAETESESEIERRRAEAAHGKDGQMDAWVTGVFAVG